MVGSKDSYENQTKNFVDDLNSTPKHEQGTKIINHNLQVIRSEILEALGQGKNSGKKILKQLKKQTKLLEKMDKRAERESRANRNANLRLDSV